MTYLKDQLKGFVPTEVAPGIMDTIARGSSILQLSDVKPMKSDTMKFQVWADKQVHIEENLKKNKYF